MKKRNQLGEIATVITLGTLIVVGLVSLISNSILKKPQTTSTKAAIGCNPDWYCAGECAPDNVRASFEAINGPANAASAWRSEKAQNCGLSENECSIATTCAPLGKPTYPQTPGVSCDANEWSCGGECASQAVRNMFGDPAKWRQEKAKNCGFPVSECSTRSDCSTTSGVVPTGTNTDRCQCVNGKVNDAKLCGDTNPCGAAIAGPCDYGAWRTDCTGSGENCPSDSGVGYTYWCDGANWRFQYPNCVVQCKPAYLTQAPSTKDPRCVGKNPGDPPNNPKTLEPVCDGSYMVTMSEYCDQFGQVQSGPGRRVDPLKSCMDKPEDQKKVCEESSGVKKGQIFRSCVKQVCDQDLGYYVCIDQYWDNNCNVQEKPGVKTATICAKTGVVPTITGRPNINWGNPPTPTIKASVIINRLTPTPAMTPAIRSGTTPGIPYPTLSPGVIGPTGADLSNVCPNGVVPGYACKLLCDSFTENELRSKYCLNPLDKCCVQKNITPPPSLQVCPEFGSCKLSCDATETSLMAKRCNRFWDICCVPTARVTEVPPPPANMCPEAGQCTFRSCPGNKVLLTLDCPNQWDVCCVEPSKLTEAMKPAIPANLCPIGLGGRCDRGCNDNEFALASRNCSDSWDICCIDKNKVNDPGIKGTMPALDENDKGKVTVIAAPPGETKPVNVNVICTELFQIANGFDCREIPVSYKTVRGRPLTVVEFANTDPRKAYYACWQNSTKVITGCQKLPVNTISTPTPRPATR